MGTWLNASDSERTKRILIVGSAPDAPTIGPFLRDDIIVIAINNAWRAVPRFDFMIYPEDLPADRKPPLSELIRKGINDVHYLEAANKFGGMFWCGFTTALVSAYWAMRTYPYSQITMFGTDMIYEGNRTHFYGNGDPDPLRRHISLQNLEGKSLRIFYHAFKRNSLVFNVSRQPKSRLALPIASIEGAFRYNIVDYIHWAMPAEIKKRIDEQGAHALDMEANAPFDLAEPNWPFIESQSAWDYVAKVDAAWQALSEHVPTIEAMTADFIASN